MKLIRFVIASLLAMTFTLFSSLSFAGAGHDHAETGPQVSSGALPRFAAISEELELVGIVNGKQLSLYLDRTADNSPIGDAQIEIEIAGNKYKAEKHADGVYAVSLNEVLKPGSIAITATIDAGSLSDLLVTELDLHDDVHTKSDRFSWKAIVTWSAVALIGLLGLVALLRRRRQFERD